MLEQVKQFVNRSFEERSGKKSFKHFERTVYWMLQLDPSADEAMLIAAYAHDIARAFRKKDAIETYKNCELNDSGVIQRHQEKGARIITEFLEKKNFERIANMIRKHEVGGDPESDLTKDSDSVSYLEINACKNIEKLSKPLGKEKIGRKITWMFKRITSKKARKISEPFYKKAMSILESS